MEPLLAPVSFCQKPNILILKPFRAREEGLAWNRHGSDVVLTLIIRLTGVDGPWLRQKLGKIQFELRQDQRQNCCHGNSITGVILFLL